MTEQALVRLADHTTLRVGGPARRFLEVRTETEAIQAVTDCDQRGEPVLLLGGGSNLLVSDDGFDGTVIKLAIAGISAEVSDCAGASVQVGAGQPWDGFVAHSVANGWAGLASLSGIPGLVGAIPIQNVGAYGAEAAQSIATVRTWDRQQQCITTLSAAECEFGYRQSRFKAEPGRFLVLQVGFQLRLGELAEPIGYPELARQLGAELGDRLPSAKVREAVLAIRRRKAMVLDEADHDTWSAGSFFTNPILTAEQAAQLPADAPQFPVGELVKTSAAWLIQNAGFPAGYGNQIAALSSKHCLALTNRGGATAADLIALANQIQTGVRARFGVSLVPEVNLVGVSL